MPDTFKEAGRALALTALVGVASFSCSARRPPEETIVTIGHFVGSFDETLAFDSEAASEAHVFLFSGQELPNIPGWVGTTLVVLPLSEHGRAAEAELIVSKRYWRLLLHANRRCDARLRSRLIADRAKLIPAVTEGLSLLPPASSFSVDVGQVRCYAVDPDDLEQMGDDYAPPPGL